MRFAAATFAILVLLAPIATADVWYVDIDNTSGTENGESWETAFTIVQDGVRAADDAGGGEVWVAEGVYDDGPGESFLVRIQPRVDFHIELYGGFTGVETERSERDWQSHETVLDGSMAGSSGRPVRCVVYAFSWESRGIPPTIDGFTITGGYAFGEDGVGDVDPEQAADSS